MTAVTGGMKEHHLVHIDDLRLAFVGLPWQHARGSAPLGLVRDDATWVAGQFEAQCTHCSRTSSPAPVAA